MALPSQQQVNATLRIGGNTVITAVTMLGALSLIPADQVQDFIAALHQFNDSIVSAYGALTKMWLIIGPVGIFILGKIGFSSASVKNLIANLMKAATSSNPTTATEAKVAIVTAAASPDIGSKAVINPEMAANPATPGNVVASVSEVPK